jgi:crossover junction endodeoxyribonuclease RuvC
MTRIIGIDPGSQRTGVGIIDVDDAGKLSHVFHGALAVADEATFPLRLKRIFDELCDIIATHQPAECGAETGAGARCGDLRHRQSGHRSA